MPRGTSAEKTSPQNLPRLARLRDPWRKSAAATAPKCLGSWQTVATKGEHRHKQRRRKMKRISTRKEGRKEGKRDGESMVKSRYKKDKDKTVISASTDPLKAGAGRCG